MSKKHRLLLILGAFSLAAVLAGWPGRPSSSAYANVTLVSFTASPVTGTADIDVEWETATEFGTVGFFVTRSDSAGGPYVRKSDFILHLGSDVVGSPYGWTDQNTVMNHTYWYKLEELTGQGSNFYGPVSATAGAAGTDTPTATPSRTPTITPSPTATPTVRPQATSARPTATSVSVVAITPRIPTGATITPRPTASGSTTNPAAFAATPTLASPVNNPQPPAPITTAMPPVSEATTGAASAPPVVADAAQGAGPTLSPTAAAPPAAAPVIVVTEAASPATASDTGGGPALILIVAAVLFLGIAFVILRQARQ